MASKIILDLLLEKIEFHKKEAKRYEEEYLKLTKNDGSVNDIEQTQLGDGLIPPKLNFGKEVREIFLREPDLKITAKEMTERIAKNNNVIHKNYLEKIRTRTYTQLNILVVRKNLKSEVISENSSPIYSINEGWKR